MAALTRLISQARRHVIRSSPFQSLHRSLCSSPSLPSDPNETNKPQRPEPTPIQPVSYAVKPKEPEKQPDPNEPTRPLSREDVRFVRDFNNPVSYGQKVAPLPEDRVGGDGEGEGVDLEAERRKIEAENRVMRRVFRGQEEEQKVPFPVLVKVDKQEDKGDGKKVALDLKEAVHLVKANAKCNFDETLEAHVKMAVDLRRTDLKLAGSLSLPHGSGKALKVAVFAEGPAADEARAAGADLVGGEDLIEGIKSGKINIKEIDKCITVPQLMPRISKEISKKLNRLTPNPRDIFSGGTDTSTITIEWAMTEMIRHPSVMKKAQDEVREAFKGKTKIKETDIQGLTYLQSVIKETLRLHPPLPLLLPHVCREQCEIGGYDIPVKTKVIVNSFACSTDPEYWEEAETFKPERFVNSSVDFMGSNYEFIPFGSGRRMCPGINFGLVSVKLFLAQMLYYFDWKLPDGLSRMGLDMTEVESSLVAKKVHLQLIPTSYAP